MGGGDGPGEDREGRGGGSRGTGARRGRGRGGARPGLTGWRRSAAMAMVVVVLGLSVVLMLGPGLQGRELVTFDIILVVAAVIMVALVRAGRG